MFLQFSVSSAARVGYRGEVVGDAGDQCLALQSEVLSARHFWQILNSL